MAIAGLVAKAQGLQVNAFGVESDEKHIQLARTNMFANGFTSNEFRVLDGAVAAEEETALFPRNEFDSINYGLQPVLNASDESVEAAKRIGNFKVVQMLALSGIFASAPKVDLLHIDIQGGEVGLVRGSMQFLYDHVSYMVIGTHSRAIEGQLIELLMNNNWVLEIERPAIFTPALARLDTTARLLP
jgi:FkbM family methyltransferase